MIRKTLLLFTVLSVFLLGCGEVGVEADISKNNEIELTVSNITSSGLVSLNETVNLAEEEYDEYLDDVDTWIVNKIEVQITGVSGTANIINTTGGDAVIRTSIDGNVLFSIDATSASFALFVDTQNNNALRAGDKIVIYDKETPSNQQVPVINTTVDAIITALQNRSTVQAALDFSGEFQSATINATVFMDITLRTKID